MEAVRPKPQAGLGVAVSGEHDRDIANLTAAINDANPVQAFMNAASPGCLVTYVPNAYYPGRDDYRAALVDAMRPEYEAIHAAGFLLPYWLGRHHGFLMANGE